MPRLFEVKITSHLSGKGGNSYLGDGNIEDVVLRVPWRGNRGVDGAWRVKVVMADSIECEIIA
jgi:hypothetical protein